MKLRNYLIITSLCLILFLIIPNTKGNPSVLPYPIYDDVAIGYYIYILLPISFLITFNIEFLVSYFFIRSYTLNFSKIYKSIFAVNFFTFPIFQLSNNFLVYSSSAYYLIFYFLIEIAPISLEFLFLVKIFKSFDRYLSYPGNKKIFLMTVVANLVTFSIGLIVFFPIIISLIG